LKLKFRQVCTADQTGEVELPDLNHYTTTEDHLDLSVKTL